LGQCTRRHCEDGPCNDPGARARCADP
jgi:hypothetical protein